MARLKTREERQSRQADRKEQERQWRARSAAARLPGLVVQVNRKEGFLSSAFEQYAPTRSHDAAAVGSVMLRDCR
jgi:hypothetical protein